MARDGFEVWSSATASLGLMLLQGRLPDVIVLESDLGVEDGFSFVAQLRGDERLANVPVLLLAKADDENVEAMADVVGVDDFIQKPAYARDVAALVRVELARREGGPLRFDSKLLPPVQLLRALMSCPRSGRLLLVDGRAEVRFRSGKVIDARFDARGGNLDTLVRALALTSGTYELVLEPVDGFAELQCGLRELVELVLPRLQKWVAGAAAQPAARLAPDGGLRPPRAGPQGDARRGEPHRPALRRLPHGGAGAARQRLQRDPHPRGRHPPLPDGRPRAGARNRRGAGGAAADAPAVRAPRHRGRGADAAALRRHRRDSQRRDRLRRSGLVLPLGARLGASSCPTPTEAGPPRRCRPGWQPGSPRSWLASSTRSR